MVIRFPDDGSRYYLPATDIRGFLADMEARGEGAPLQRVGAAEEANDAAAIEVLAQALTRKNQAATGGSLHVCSERLAAGCQVGGWPAGASQPQVRLPWGFAVCQACNRSAAPTSDILSGW